MRVIADSIVETTAGKVRGAMNKGAGAFARFWDGALQEPEHGSRGCAQKTRQPEAEGPTWKLGYSSISARFS